MATPTVADYGQDYFTTLYGSLPQQTVVDRGRDWLIRRLVSHYSPGGRLLEIGCGFGYLLGSFDDRWALHGTDISPHAAAVAQRRLARAHVVAADIQDGLPYQGQFDVVVAINVMEHLPQPAVAAAVLSQTVRPGGLFVAHLPTISSPLAGWIYDRTYASDVTHVYRPSGAAFNAVIEAAGFTNRELLYCPFWPAALWRWLNPHPAYLAVFTKN